MSAELRTFARQLVIIEPVLRPLKGPFFMRFLSSSPMTTTACFPTAQPLGASFIQSP
jgi:hypothetical protein